MAARGATAFSALAASGGIWHWIGGETCGGGSRVPPAPMSLCRMVASRQPSGCGDAEQRPSVASQPPLPAVPGRLALPLSRAAAAQGHGHAAGPRRPTNRLAALWKVSDGQATAGWWAETTAALGIGLGPLR